MSQQINVTLTINGQKVTLLTAPEQNLLRLLRNNGYYDVKCGCEEGDCGTCTVLFNGVAVKSCVTLAMQAEGADIQTVKGMEKDDIGAQLQAAFVKYGSIQCGFCTPGMIIAAKTYLDNGGKADREAIRKAISGNLCRCTGYKKIIDAIYAVAKDLGREVC